MNEQWTLILFVALSCCGTGLFTAVALAEYRQLTSAPLTPLSAISFILIAAGCICAALNLGHPELLLNAFSHFGTPISFELTFSLLTLLMIAFYVIAVRRESDYAVTKNLALLGALFGFALCVAAGFALYMPWRAAWSTVFLIFPYPAWSLAIATAAYKGLISQSEEIQNIDEVTPNPLIASALTGLPVILVFVYLGVLLLSGEPASEIAMSAIVPAGIGLLFWIGIVLFGGVLPVALNQIHRVGKDNLWTQIGAVGFLFIGTAAWQWLVLDLDSPAWQFFKR